MPARLKSAPNPPRNWQTARRMIDYSFWSVAHPQFHLLDSPGKFEVFSPRFEKIFVKPFQLFENIEADRQIAAPEKVSSDILTNFLQRMIRSAKTDGFPFDYLRGGRYSSDFVKPFFVRNTIVV